MPEIDWEQEVNSARTEVQRALQRALKESANWNRMLIVYSEQLDDRLEAVGWINIDGSQTTDDIGLLEMAKLCLHRQWAAGGTSETLEEE